MKGDLHYGFQFGDWQAFPTRNLLLGPPGEIHIEPKVMQVLVCLAGNPEQVVDRETLLSSVWEGRAFSDEPLSRCIFQLRQALGDSSRNPNYIETIPKSGYRLLCAVEPLPGATSNANDDVDEKGVTHHSEVMTGRRRVVLTTFLGLILLAVILAGNRSGLFSSNEPPQLAVEGATTPAPSVYSVAVLPFRNRSAEAGDAFFVDGIHDDIVTQLARLSSLDKVISRTSMERYRETVKPISQIAQELAVAFVLDGSVQRAGERVRINVQLIEAATDDHLWVESYDRQLTANNLFSIQSAIAREVVGALRVVLTPEESERLQIAPTTSLDAYGKYAMGRREIARRNADSTRRAQILFEEAIELDPDYALAYVGLADSLALQTKYSDRAVSETLVQRQEAINAALRLDPQLGEAYVPLAWLRVHEFKNEEAEKYFQEAMKLSPNYAVAYQGYAEYLSMDSQFVEALPYARKALSLDPLDSTNTAVLAQVLLMLGRFDESYELLQDAITQDPDFPGYYGLIAAVLNHLGRMGEATVWLRAGATYAPAASDLMQMECYQYVLLRDRRAAEHCFEKLSLALPGNDYTWAKVDFYGSHSDYQRAVHIAEEIVRRDPLSSNKFFLAWTYLDNEEFDKARSILQEFVPEYFGEQDILVTRQNLHLAIYAGHSLYLSGERDRANYLFDQALEVMRSMPATLLPSVSFYEILIHNTRGETRKAISVLRGLVDQNLLINVFWFRSPIFDNMRDEPEWNKLLSGADDYVAGQLQWFENHKDAPLF